VTEVMRDGSSKVRHIQERKGLGLLVRVVCLIFLCFYYQDSIQVHEVISYIYFTSLISRLHHDVKNLFHNDKTFVAVRPTMTV